MGCNDCGPKTKVKVNKSNAAGTGSVPPASGAGAAGVKVRASGEHRTKDGKLVVRFSTTPPPEPMTCITPSCYLAFVKRVIRYMLTLTYHKKRMQYAEKYRNKDIPEHYRTGNPMPDHLTWEIIKLGWR